MRTETSIIDGIPVTSYFHEESDMSTEEQKITWLNVCDKCMFKERDICGSCGCPLEKVMFYNDAKCPENKW
jgi:rRNA maturation endonuclease Nob1